MGNVIGHSKTPEENLVGIYIIFEHIFNAGLKLEPSKCHFLKTRVKFLGHVILKDGINTDPDKIRALCRWPTPKNHDMI